MILLIMGEMVLPTSQGWALKGVLRKWFLGWILLNTSVLNSIIGYNDVYIYHGCNIACHFLATDCIYIEVLSEFELHVGTRSFYSY